MFQYMLCDTGRNNICSSLPHPMTAAQIYYQQHNHKLILYMVKNYFVIYENVKIPLGFDSEGDISTIYVRDLKDEVFNQTGVPPEYQDLHCREGKGGVIGDILLGFSLENMGLNETDEIFLLELRENAVLEKEAPKEEVIFERMEFNPGQSIQHTIGAGGCDEIATLISRTSNLVVCVWGELTIDGGEKGPKIHKIYPFYFRTAAGCDGGTWCGMLREWLLVSVATPAAIGACYVGQVIDALDGGGEREESGGGGAQWTLHITTTRVTDPLPPPPTVENQI